LDAFANFSQIKELYILHNSPDDLLILVKSCFTIIEAAGGVIRRKDGKLLAIFRNGKWDLPKGKVEKGEFYKQTAIREVQEECGLTHLEVGKSLSDTYHVYKEHGKIILKRTLWFEMLLTDNERPLPQEEEGITEVRWFDYHSMGEIMKNTYDSLKETIIEQISPE